MLSFAFHVQVGFFCLFESLMFIQVPKRKTYYDYAEKKLDIARENGIIPPKGD